MQDLWHLHPASPEVSRQKILKELPAPAILPVTMPVTQRATRHVIQPVTQRAILLATAPVFQEGRIEKP